jgi:carbon storage regulator
MLVFTRKRGESLIIGNEIEVTILSLGCGSVKIGISAPRCVSVHRKEVYDAIRKAQDERPSSEAVCKNDGGDSE